MSIRKPETRPRSFATVATSSALTAALIAVGCATQLERPPDQTEIQRDSLPETTEVATNWAAPASDTGAVDGGWLASFRDPDLNALVEEALSTQNPNLRILAAQVDRAAAQARLAGAALKPTVTLGANLAETGGNDLVAGTAGDVGAGASWEWDVWGRVRAGAAAGEESLRATVADFEYARQSLVANVAKLWFLATELRMQVELGRETVAILTELVELVEAKETVGQISMQDVHLVRAELASAEDALRQAIGGEKQVQRALEILLGRYPAAEIETAGELVPVPAPVPAGLPADLVARRPDLIASERRVAVAFNLSEEARLARLPRLSLNAGLGASTDLSGLITQLGAGLVAPLYTGGALEAQIELANADQQAAIAAYGAALLRAFEEVETSLENEELLSERETFLTSAVAGNLEAYNLARVQYDVGKIDLLSVLQMQTRWLGARIGLLRIRNERLAQRIDLHLALGGSFEQTEGVSR